MRGLAKLVFVIVVACTLDDGIVKCADGWSCPSGTACLSEPVGDVHCVSLLCGNGVVDANEQCDGEVATSCTDLGVEYDAGRPRCTSRCTIDVSTCEKFGFETLFEGGARINRFCAYETTPGHVVAHFFQEDLLVRVDGDDVSELAGSFVAPKDIACVPGKIAAITTNKIAVYRDGEWITDDDIALSDGTGIRWEQVTETDVDLAAIGWNFLTAGGYGGVVAFADGVGWNIDTEQGSPLLAIDGRNGIRVAVAEFGQLFQRAISGTWSTLTLQQPFAGNLASSVWVLDAGDIVASSSTVIARFRNGTYAPLAATPGRIVATQSGRLFVAGVNGFLSHLDRYTWHRTSTALFDDMWISSTDDIYAARGSELLRASALWFELPFTGTTLTTATINNVPTLIMHRSGRLAMNNVAPQLDPRAAHVATSDRYAFAVGGTPPTSPRLGYLARLDLTSSATWTSGVQAPNGVRFTAVVAADPDRAWAVGEMGVVWAYTAGTWAARAVVDPAVTLHRIARTPSGELVTVGTAGTIATSTDNGATWTRVESGVPDTLYEVVAHGDDVLVAGDNGTVVRRVAGEWSLVPTPTTRSLRAIAADGERLVAAGDRTIIEFDGTQWTTIRPPSAGTTFTSVLLEPPYLYIGGTGDRSFVLYRP